MPNSNSNSTGLTRIPRPINHQDGSTSTGDRWMRTVPAASAHGPSAGTSPAPADNPFTWVPSSSAPAPIFSADQDYGILNGVKQMYKDSNPFPAPEPFRFQPVIDSNDDPDAALVYGANVPTASLRYMSEHGDVAAGRALAGRDDATRHDLWRLAHSDDRQTQRVVAGNKTTADHTLEFLVDTRNFAVRAAAVNNTAIDDSTLIKLAKNGSLDDTPIPVMSKNLRRFIAEHEAAARPR